ncbi:MAG TPA: hypothetical protein VK619_10260 [Pyrinomonadaceae bacterium]|nr:hypothetical protein [Pyrinomonadaceae bacterium]
MATSRRKFLKTGTLVALTAGLPLTLVGTAAGKVATAGAANASTPMRNFGNGTFEQHVGSKFRTSAGEASIDLTLKNVRQLARPAKGRPALPGGEGYALTFRGSHSNPLAQDTYTLEHARLGTFSMMLVPVISKDKSARHYEAVVNRLF